MSKKINLEELNLEGLKALVYDVNVEMLQKQNTLKVLDQEIKNRLNDTKTTSETTGTPIAKDAPKGSSDKTSTK